MIKRLKQVPSFLRGELIVLQVDASTESLKVDAGNKSAAELKKAANTLFKKVYNLSNAKKVTS